MTPTEPVVPEPGALLEGRYRIGQRLGSGAMAEVFEAHDERLDRTVAVKRFRSRPEDRVRFEREITLLASLQHRHIVGLYDAGGVDDVPFVVLERCARTLDDRLRAGPMTSDEVATLGTGLAEALAAVHGAGMVHRDVKPSNVLLADDGRALLGDFGIARLLDATRLTDAAMTIGTLAYLAPEQAAGEDVGPPADVYALGLVLLEALTGRRVFEGSQQELLAARLLRDPEVPATLPPPWR
jgi:serine/threonine protein kinase